MLVYFYALDFLDYLVKVLVVKYFQAGCTLPKVLDVCHGLRVKYLKIKSNPTRVSVGTEVELNEEMTP